VGNIVNSSIGDHACAYAGYWEGAAGNIENACNGNLHVKMLDRVEVLEIL
jgi:hypothetical protein